MRSGLNIGNGIIVLLLIAFALPFSVCAADLVVNFPASSYKVDSFAVQETNAFYSFFKQYPEDPFIDASVTVKLLDAGGSVIYESAFAQPWISNYYPGASRILVVSGSGETLSDNPVSFCDDDGVCEPCYLSGCGLSENYLACGDCKSGSSDLFCDIVKDGVCDPDCEGRDGDCLGCSPYCLFEGSGSDCADISGVVCGPQEDCYGGVFVSSDDSDNGCCVGGTCRNLGEYVESAALLKTQPSLTITPNGAFASSIQQQGFADYCQGSLGGMDCEPNQFCNGTDVEYYQDVYCCVGVCITPEDAIFTERVDRTIMAEVPVDEMDAFIERDKAHFDIEQEMMAGESAEKFAAVVDKIVPPIPEVLKGSGLPLIVGALLVILLIITVIVALFMRSASKKVNSGQDIAPQEGDIQQNINLMLSKGYNYTQIKEYFIQKGIPQEKIDLELRKDYESRRPSQPR